MFSQARTLLLATLSFLLLGAADDDGARSIMEEQRTRHQAQSEILLSTMVVRSRSGDAKTRRLVAKAVTSGGNTRTLLKFIEPADIRNVGLLTWSEGSGKSDDQWLYLEASKQTRRIVGSAKKNAFMGTDIAYEDLRPEDLSAHSYTLVGEQVVSGEKTWKIEAVPATAAEQRESGYAKRVMWIRQDNYMTVMTSFRDRRDREIKRANYSAMKRISGNMWRADRTFVKTIRTGTSTFMQVDDRRINEAISSQDFLPQNIARQARFR